jgi:hypothetical protein
MLIGGEGWHGIVIAVLTSLAILQQPDPDWEELSNLIESEIIAQSRLCRMHGA